MGLGQHIGLWLLASATATFGLAGSAHAQLEATTAAPLVTESIRDVQPVGDSLAALPGLVRLPVVTELDTGLAAIVLAGYGYRGAVVAERDRHHRTQGDIAASYRPTRWLAIAGWFSGRYDRHTRTGAQDAGWVGDPRLIARAGTEVSPGLWLGTQLGVWFPGGQAPSIEPDAITGDGRALVSWTAAGAPLTLAAQAGFRFDRSARSAPDADRLSPSDRMSLGVSDSHAVLLGAGGAVGVGRGQLVADVTWDYLIGDDAPELAQFPLRVGAGFRHPIGDQLTAHVLVELSLSDPDLSMTDVPLYPVDPLLSAMAGLSYRFGHSRTVTGTEDDAIGDKDDGEVIEPPVAKTGMVVVAVIDEAGTAIAGAEVTVTGADGASHSETTGEDGRASFADIDIGQATVAVDHDEFDQASRTVDIAAGTTRTTEFRLAATLPPGQLRGVVRSFGGKPLPARLTIEPLGTHITANQDGEFEVDLPPGSYQVTVEAERFSSQTRDVVIEQNGVTILNVDMRK